MCEKIMIHRIISKAIHDFLAQKLQTSVSKRCFFRLDGFDRETYEVLLKMFHKEGDTVAGQPLWIRTIVTISGYDQYTLEPGKSATWYRNHIPQGYALVLIFNQHTSDAQSLKDIYPVTESRLVTEGLKHLFASAFVDYQISSQELNVLEEFLRRVRWQLFQPQLRDLVAFLTNVNRNMYQNPGMFLKNSIVESLPYLGIFRCRELANLINTTKGNRLLRNVFNAARLGSELLDETELNNYLDRLEKAEFEDDSLYGGSSPEKKRTLLYRFLTEVIAEYQELQCVLQLDWREVAPVLYKKTRKIRPEQLKELAAALEASLELQQLNQSDLPDPAKDTLQDLKEGRDPEEAGLDILLADYGDSISKSVKNKLLHFRGARKHETSDFVAGVCHLAVEMLTPLHSELLERAKLQIDFDEGQFDRIGLWEAEALVAFRYLYGGIENIMPSVHWELEALNKRAGQYAFQVGEEEEEEEGEREKLRKIRLLFNVRVFDSEGNQLDRAVLTWQYRSDGPAAATLFNLKAECALLGSLNAEGQPNRKMSQLRIPIYNTCPEADDIGDLDLSRPVSSLGAWYRDAADLSRVLRDELKSRARPKTWNALETALAQLESAWGKFVTETTQYGVFASDLNGLLDAYHRLLETATIKLQQGQEVSHSFHILNQAWIVGPPSFDEWAVIPFLHPFKLHWWQERARQFETFIARLLDVSDGSITIVDENRFRQELVSTYRSANYPAVLSLSGRQGRADYFLPINEVEGYELFRWVEKAGLAHGLNPELVTKEESERAVQLSTRDLVRVIQDYIETYPFAQDGLEIYLVQCHNSSLPGLIVEQLNRYARRKRSDLRLKVIIHTTDHGAPIYRRVMEWMKVNEEFAVCPMATYFPPIMFKILECEYADLYHGHDTDIVILPDVLAEKGQMLKAEINPIPEESVSLKGYLPIYNIQQTPFERGEVTRDILLTQSLQPDLVRQFYNVQWAARERKAVASGNGVTFRLQISLQDWEKLLISLHNRFNWVICYDTTIDRFLLEDTFPNTIEVIRYSLGLGIKRRHNLTVSSSHRTQDIVVRRLTANLETLLPSTPHDFRHKVAQCLVDEAKQVSGDIVLRAAGPGAYLNELIGMVVAKFNTERRYLQEHPGALIAWIYLDDFNHWFDRRVPDLLFVAIPPEAKGGLTIHVELLETKCVGESNFAQEAAEAQLQVSQGVNRLAQALQPNANHLDAPYWYNQFYQAVVGNLAVQRDKMHLWDAFHHQLPKGDFILEFSGNAWVFCYNGVTSLSEEGVSKMVAPEASDVPHFYHFFGRAGLRKLLRNLVEDEWHFEAPSDTWSEIYDNAPIVDTAQADKESVPTVIEDTVLPSQTALSTSAESETAKDALADWLKQKSDEIARALHNYSLKIYPIEGDKADVGPSIVRFKVRLRPGEKISRLQSIASDLQRELALESVPIIDNVRGTSYVGIDLPHPSPTPIYLITALTEIPQAAIGQLPFLLGKSPDGHIELQDLVDLHHMLVAGSTGSGKTIFLYTLIVSLIQQFGPDDLSLLLIDPKQTDFVYFEGLPHLFKGQVVIEPEEAIALLEQLTAEHIVSRTQQLRQARRRDIRDYNASYADAPLNPIVVIIDEYADLVQVLDRGHRESFERQLVRLAQRARNVGIHLVIATQRPTADIVTTNLKANLPARIAFRLPSYHDSMTILDQAGAENLVGKGDMLFRAGGRVDRLQGFYLTSEELEEFLRCHRMA